MDTVLSIQGDTVDALCYRYYGYTARAVEAVYQANPGLADLGPTLPTGARVVMPVVTEKHSAEIINLWT